MAQIKRKRECACGDAYADDEDSDFAPSPKRVKHNEPMMQTWQPVFFPEQNLAQQTEVLDCGTLHDDTLVGLRNPLESANISTFEDLLLCGQSQTVPSWMSQNTCGDIMFTSPPQQLPEPWPATPVLQPPFVQQPPFVPQPMPVPQTYPQTSPVCSSTQNEGVTDKKRVQRHKRRARDDPERKQRMDSRRRNQDTERPPTHLKTKKRNLALYSYGIAGTNWNKVMSRQVEERKWLRTHEALHVTEHPENLELAESLVADKFYWLKTGLAGDSKVAGGMHGRPAPANIPVLALPHKYGTAQKKNNTWVYLCTINTTCHHTLFFHGNQDEETLLEAAPLLPSTVNSPVGPRTAQVVCDPDIQLITAPPAIQLSPTLNTKLYQDVPMLQEDVTLYHVPTQS